jgi:aminoglycoside phosphotransferase (APT) family kinase protein
MPLAPELHDWLSARLDTSGPFESTPISGGHSNVTSMLTAPDGRWILRHPPATKISVTANNLGREYRVLSALSETEVPVPRALGFAAPGEVLEHAVLLMDLAPGYPLTDTWPANWPSTVSIGAAGTAAVEALAALHQVDVDAVGLSDFGRPANYLQRQVDRWRGQYEQNKVRDLPQFDRLASWLSANQPDETAPTLIHGDFRLDNCLIVPGPPTRVKAIIDWELSTVGDPLVDLGLMLAFWGADRATPIPMPRVQALSRAPGTPSRRELADVYTASTGRSTAALNWYIALALFKLAAIVEGAYARFVKREYYDPWAASLEEDVPGMLADAALHAV